MKELKKQIIINNEPTHYYITSLGRLFNQKNNTWFKGTIKGGYLVYELRWKNKKYSKLAHRLVAENFIPCENMINLVVNHKDGNKLNNQVDNLEFLTVQENNIHALTTGLKKPGNYKEQRESYSGDLVNEIWKTYHDTVFSISNKGRAKNNKTGNLIKGKINNKGYVEWCFSINGKKQTIFAHRAVYELFGNEPLQNDLVVNHIDGRKTNNQIDNLEQITRSENVLHSYYITQINPHKKIVQKYSLNGELIEEYNSANEAARKNEGCYSNLIINVCNGKTKTHNGYIWKYK